MPKETPLSKVVHVVSHFAVDRKTSRTQTTQTDREVVTVRRIIDFSNTLHYLLLPQQAYQDSTTYHYFYISLYLRSKRCCAKFVMENASTLPCRHARILAIFFWNVGCCKMTQNKEIPKASPQKMNVKSFSLFLPQRKLKFFILSNKDFRSRCSCEDYRKFQNRINIQSKIQDSLPSKDPKPARRVMTRIRSNYTASMPPIPGSVIYLRCNRYKSRWLGFCGRKWGVPVY